MTANGQRVYAVLLASGTGSRMGGGMPKQFTVIAGKTILEHAIQAFETCSVIDEIVIVAHPEFLGAVEEICKKTQFQKVSSIVPGGITRFESSYRGVSTVPGDAAYVLIHDVARPCVSHSVILRCVEGLMNHPAVTAAVPATDTVFLGNGEGKVEGIPDRSSMYLIQTPQGFHRGVIALAHERALADSAEPTDDCSLVVKYTHSPVYLVMGDYQNIKVTHPIDLVVASAILTP